MRFFSIFAMSILAVAFVSAEKEGDDPVVVRYFAAAGSAEPSLKCDAVSCNSDCVNNWGWAGGFCFMGDCWCYI
ncbi:unnamed protein product [Acanthoscelides obtectus]|uniref:Uncharacterized protein n=1 Tax=Acanthoscelides obtectus TaxID=200917 RepID=A0A9P0M7Z5_ACAOB|nr:unnamed protein product [Acanthoscelides obtectus]CAK1651606.1 hypothetical protein AOBTE_LOCUS17353 [Acanthoscelides obtectus]